MKTDPGRYQSYLLRLFRDGLDGVWRASLQNVATGERKGFADLDALFVYLCARTGQSSPRIPVDRLKTGTKKEDPQ